MSKSHAATGINGESKKIHLTHSGPYHGFAKRNVSVKYISLYDKYQMLIKAGLQLCVQSRVTNVFLLPEETKCVFPQHWPQKRMNIWIQQEED